MLRLMLRILAVLCLFGGLGASAIASYLLFTPGDEEALYEQKYKEMIERREQARVARDPAEKARLQQESEEAANSAKAWGEGVRARRRGVQLGLGVGCVVVLFSFIVLFLTLVGRKAVPTPA